VNLRRKTDVPEAVSEAQPESTPPSADVGAAAASPQQHAVPESIIPDVDEPRRLARPDALRSTTSTPTMDRHRRPAPSPLATAGHHRHSLDDIDTTPTASPQSLSTPRPAAAAVVDISGSGDRHRDAKGSAPLLSAPSPARHQAAPSDAGLDQQWIMKMASEIARRVYDEKRRQGAWEDAPPAYEAT
jgi:distribution and morphology protein 34